MRKLTDHKMNQLLRNTVVKHSNGSPLIVYRGEHGEVDESKPGFQSKLGSLSFGTAEGASGYALNPNDHRVSSEAPRVYPVYLIMNKPFIANEHDPFLQFSDTEKILGRDAAIHFFTKFSGYAEYTNAWCEIADEGGFDSVEQFLKLHPERGHELYANLWPFLDDKEFIDALKAKGFDGAIYAGSGATMRQPEYRVFDESSVIYVLTKDMSPKLHQERKHESPDLVA